ncbi:MAG: hypothetical protein ACRD0V_20345 [Acidimicrobiales bacterium]
MQEDLAQSELGDLRERLVQVVLGDQTRLLGVGDVDDVDIGALLVVDDHRVGLGAGVPGEDAVDLIGGLLARA